MGRGWGTGLVPARGDHSPPSLLRGARSANEARKFSDLFVPGPPGHGLWQLETHTSEGSSAVDNCKCKQAVTNAFEDVAMALGGVVASYPVPDDAVWELARALDVIHSRVCVRCGVQAFPEAEGPGDAQHPAIVHLLAQLHGQSPAVRTAR